MGFQSIELPKIVLGDVIGLRVKKAKSIHLVLFLDSLRFRLSWISHKSKAKEHPISCGLLKSRRPCMRTYASSNLALDIRHHLHIVTSHSWLSAYQQALHGMFIVFGTFKLQFLENWANCKSSQLFKYQVVALKLSGHTSWYFVHVERRWRGATWQD